MEMTVFVKGLRLEARHGVMEQERTVGNTFELDIELHMEATVAATQRDELEGTVDYGEVVAIARREMAIPSQLLEHATARLRRALLDRWPQLTGGSIRLTKLTPPLGVETAGAGVILAW